jgi:hypothetical protein
MSDLVPHEWRLTGEVFGDEPGFSATAGEAVWECPKCGRREPGAFPGEPPMTIEDPDYPGGLPDVDCVRGVLRDVMGT